MRKTFNHPAPVTKIPLSIAESEYDLQGATGSTKPKLRNHILKKTDAISHSYPKSAVWIHGVYHIVRSQRLESTYKICFDRVLKKMALPKDSQVYAVHIVLDKYIKDSKKSGERRSRGKTNSIWLNVTGFRQPFPAKKEDLLFIVGELHEIRANFFILSNYN